ncbi:mitochondrial fission 1 protein [Plakobranchus ocellatus]|uniref:Mitochondrial fission 1 protein n=1 Tax=Plakobranchus ocellatus TaxID=259542 RepID=A0AAV4DMG4_9GAST|nr:mitochondrial fission 1 protein [Plakobranchus ocellatus]
MEEIVNENVSATDLKKYESVYLEQQRRGHVSEKTQFDYALCLVRSKYEEDKYKGVSLLMDLLRSSSDNQSMRDYYFFIAIAYTRLKLYEKALDYVEPIFKIEPSNRQAKELKAYIKKKLKTDGLIGMAVVGGAALALGGVVAATIAAIRK